MKKPATPAPLNRMISSKQVRVRVVQRQPLAEASASEIGNTLIYQQGDTFETTAERAEALGNAVERVLP